MKVAVTLWSEFIVTLQVPVPLQAPPQPWKIEPFAGLAVSVTWVPVLKLAVQVDGHLIPAGELVTLPLPVTPTERVWVPGVPKAKATPEPPFPPWEVVP